MNFYDPFIRENIANICINTSNSINLNSIKKGISQKKEDDQIIDKIKTW